jgi:hypothetical protein
MNQDHNSASRRIEMLRAFDKFAANRAALLQLPGPASAAKQRDKTPSVRSTPIVVSTPRRAPSSPQAAPAQRIEHYMLDERAYLLEFGH